MNDDEFIDITAPEHAEVLVSRDGKILWVNINGVCRLRACKIFKMVVHDDRPREMKKG